jgi:hypothetical protein
MSTQRVNWSSVGADCFCEDETGDIRNDQSDGSGVPDSIAVSIKAVPRDRRSQADTPIFQWAQSESRWPIKSESKKMKKLLDKRKRSI